MSLHDTIMPLWGKTFLQLISIFVFSKSCTVSSGCLGKHLVVTISIHFLLSSAVFPWRLSQLLICCMPAPLHPDPSLRCPLFFPYPCSMALCSASSRGSSSSCQDEALKQGNVYCIENHTHQQVSSAKAAHFLRLSFHWFCGPVCKK